MPSSCSGILRRLDEHLVGDFAEAAAARRCASPRAVPVGASGSGGSRSRSARPDLDLGRIDVRERDLLQPAAVVGQLHRAPVGERGHRELRDALQRLPVVERRGEHLRRGSAKKRSRSAASCSSVTSSITLTASSSPSRPRARVALVRNQCSSPGRAVDALGRAAARRLAGQDAVAGQLLDPHRPAVGVADLEARRQILGSEVRTLGRPAARAAAPRPRSRRPCGRACPAPSRPRRASRGCRRAAAASRSGGRRAGRWRAEPGTADEQGREARGRPRGYQRPEPPTPRPRAPADHRPARAGCAIVERRRESCIEPLIVVVAAHRRAQVGV